MTAPCRGRKSVCARARSLEVEVANGLEQPTTVHWHGLRVPHAMDGVPELTQPPIAPGESLHLPLCDLPDAGTYWYHPHVLSSRQIGRGPLRRPGGGGGLTRPLSTGMSSG